MYKKMDKGEIQEAEKVFSIIPSVHTDCHLKKNKPKNGPPYRRQVVHARPETPQGESAAMLGTILLIILSLIRKADVQMSKPHVS